MRASILAVGAVLTTCLTACAVGQPTGFTGRTERTCSDAGDAIAELPRPRTPQDAIRYALDRYTVVEKVVATVTAARVPAGSAGRAVRDRWLGPAHDSLRAGRIELDRLRVAVRDQDWAGARTAFAQAATSGNVGVDAAVFAERALPRCRTVFTTPAPPISW